MLYALRVRSVSLRADFMRQKIIIFLFYFKGFLQGSEMSIPISFTLEFKGVKLSM